jgi:hypothetical protein
VVVWFSIKAELSPNSAGSSKIDCWNLSVVGECEHHLGCLQSCEVGSKLDLVLFLLSLREDRNWICWRKCNGERQVGFARGKSYGCICYRTYDRARSILILWNRNNWRWVIKILHAQKLVIVTYCSLATDDHSCKSNSNYHLLRRSPFGY